MPLDKAIRSPLGQQKACCAGALSSDVGNWMVGKFQAGPIPALRRRALPLPRFSRRPPADVLKDAPHYVRVLEERHDTHWSFADWAFQRICFVDLTLCMSLAQLDIAFASRRGSSWAAGALFAASRRARCRLEYHPTPCRGAEERAIERGAQRRRSRKKGDRKRVSSINRVRVRSGRSSTRRSQRATGSSA
jgi:hypothetical protein